MLDQFIFWLMDVWDRFFGSDPPDEDARPPPGRM